VVGAFPDVESALMLAGAKAPYITGTKWGTRQIPRYEPSLRNWEGGPVLEAGVHESRIGAGAVSNFPAVRTSFMPNFGGGGNGPRAPGFGKGNVFREALGNLCENLNLWGNFGKLNKVFPQ